MDAVESTANSLLLRKANLKQLRRNADGDVNERLTKEDLINDWFASLFNARMTLARIGFEDQKRVGKSATGLDPGEVDGYIVDAQNKNLAVFEAFRLFYADRRL